MESKNRSAGTFVSALKRITPTTEMLATVSPVMSEVCVDPAPGRFRVDDLCKGSRYVKA